MPKARSLRLSTGFKVPLDGDLLAIVEALYGEITLGDVLTPSFETMRSEILSLIDQMSASERETYLAESLFLNSVTYENEMLSAYARSLGTKTPPSSTKRKSRTKRKSKTAQRRTKTAR